MTPKITSEQRDALNQGPGPVLVEDDETKQRYYLVDPTYFQRMFDLTDLAAIRQGIDDFAAGRKSLLKDAVADIKARHLNDLAG